MQETEYPENNLSEDAEKVFHFLRKQYLKQKPHGIRVIKRETIAERCKLNDPEFSAAIDRLVKAFLIKSTVPMVIIDGRHKRGPKEDAYHLSEEGIEAARRYGRRWRKWCWHYGPAIIIVIGGLLGTLIMIWFLYFSGMNEK